jgi:selenide, water dikinase
MAQGARLTIEIDVRSLPVIEGAVPLAVPRFFTRASTSNREFLEGHLRTSPQADPQILEFAFDAQTSGGLLIAVSADHVSRLLDELRNRGAMAASVVGRVVERAGETAIVLS